MDDDGFPIPALPDVSGLTMAELIGCDNPAVIAATERLIRRVLEADPEDGCC
jgi:hypothetical protein